MASLADEGQVLQVLGFLEPKTAACARATSKTGIFAKLAGSEALWSALLGRAFGLTGSGARVGPSGEVADSALRAFSLWYCAARDVGLQETCSQPGHRPLPPRWVALWSRLRRWVRAEAPQVADTLRPPVREEVLARLHEEGYPMAHPLVTGIWSVHNGQTVPADVMSVLMRADQEEDSADAGRWDGLFGGYSVYNHLVCTLLLPLEVALSLTARLRSEVQVIMEEHSTKLAFACSLEFTKILLVDVRDGGVYVWTKRLQPSVVRAVPRACTLAPDACSEGAKVRLTGLRGRPELNGRRGLLAGFDSEKGRWQVAMEDGSGTHLLKLENLQDDGEASSSAGEPSADGLLRWFEEFVRRLEEQVYVRQPLKPEWPAQSRGLCLFPANGPDVSHCVTRGVEVTASCVYMPEHQGQGWGYSIALRLVGSEEERGFRTCQLHTRTWVIQEDGQEPELINGEGVIGLFPILTDGGWICNRESDPHNQYASEGLREGAFRYQSCTNRFPSMRGSFGGKLCFVPGTVKKPVGRPFDVRLEPFKLYVPEYIF